jgi:hypothetical protein
VEEGKDSEKQTTSGIGGIINYYQYCYYYYNVCY